MTRILNTSQDTRYASAVLCKLNHRDFTTALEKATSGLHDMDMTAFRAAALKQLRQVPESSVFTTSFDGHSRAAALAAESRGQPRRSIAIVELLKEKVMGDVINMKTVHRLELGVHYHKMCGLLTGKNGMAILERLHKKSHRQCKWVTLPGSLMGPGGKCGSNLYEKTWKQANKKDDSVASSIWWWPKASLHGKRWRRDIGVALGRFRKLQKSGGLSVQERSALHDIIHAGEDMLTYSDSGYQFLLCEEAKLVAFILNLDKRYMRNRSSDLVGDVGTVVKQHKKRRVDGHQSEDSSCSSSND